MSNETTGVQEQGADEFENVVLPSIETNKPFGTEKKGKQERETNQVWANIGVVRKDGEGKDVFVGLPLGVPCDGLKAKKVPGSDTDKQDYRNLVIAQNAFLEAFQKHMAGLKPGQEKVLNLQVQIRRIKEGEKVTEADKANNPLLAGGFSF